MPLAAVILTPPTVGTGATLLRGTPTTATSSPYVTLQPPGPSGGIPGDANDPADFYGLGAAVLAIVFAVVVTRWFFRGRGGTHEGSRSDP